MKKIYKPDFVIARTNQLKAFDELEDSGQKKELTYADVLCNPEYRKASFVGMVLSMLQQLTGINTIIFYSNTIFAAGTSIPPQTTTFMIGVVNFFATVGGMILLGFFGRRSISLVC